MPSASALLFVVLAAPPQSGALRTTVREALTEAISSVDPEQRAGVAARLAEELGDDVRIADVVAAVRMGPLIDPRPEARVVAGREEVLRTFGTVTSGFLFEHQGHVIRYAADVPRKLDFERGHGLLIDPGHGTGRALDEEGKAGMIGMYRNHADSAKLRDWIVVRTEIIEQFGAGGPRELPEDEVGAVFDAFFRDLATRFPLDPDRIVVSGVSQTGFWAWFLGRYRADRLAGIAPMGASSWPADAYLGNFLNLPVFTLHGTADTTVPIDGARATTARLAGIGGRVVHREIEGAEHDYGTWQHLPGALEWIAERPRDPYPRRVSQSLQSARAGWCYWLRVDELADEGPGRAGDAPTGGVDGLIEGQTVTIYSEGVERVSVCLSGELLDLDQEIEIVWNGERKYSGRVEQSVETLLGLAADKVDWRGTFGVAISLRTR